MGPITAFIKLVDTPTGLQNTGQWQWIPPGSHRVSEKPQCALREPPVCGRGWWRGGRHSGIHRRTAAGGGEAVAGDIKADGLVRPCFVWTQGRNFRCGNASCTKAWKGRNETSCITASACFCSALGAWRLLPAESPGRFWKRGACICGLTDCCAHPPPSFCGTVRSTRRIFCLQSESRCQSRRSYPGI